MPKIFRSMLEDHSKPKVGNDGRTLGVRIAPNSRPDIPVDASGNVHPGTGGMSVAPDWRVLPYFLIPSRLNRIVPRARGKDDLACWSFGVGPFQDEPINNELMLRVDKASHGLLEPHTGMAIDKYQEALARTRDQWVVDEA